MMTFILLLFLSLGAANIVQGELGNPPGYGLQGLVQSFDIQDVDGISEDSLRNLIIPEYIESFLTLFAAEPEAVGESLFADMTNEACMGHVSEWIIRAMNPNLVSEEDVWVLHMFDSWGKPPEGALMGHINALGDFDECVDIAVKNLVISSSNTFATPSSFEGRYCHTILMPWNKTRFGRPEATTATPFKEPNPELMALWEEVKPKRTGAVSPIRLLEIMGIQGGVFVYPSMGMCFPSSCEKSDIETMMVNAFSMIYTRENETVGTLWPAVEYCPVGDQPELDAGDISVIVLLSLIVGLVALASIVDIILNRGKENEKPPQRGIGYHFLIAFSLYTNIQKWLSTRPSADDLGCIHGIRVLSTTYVVLAHTWYVITFIPYWNSVDVKLLADDWRILAVLNSTVSVDTFFMLSGLLVAYNVLKLLNKTKGKLNIPMFYVHRYLRLTPVYAVLIGVMATLVPYLARGPHWAVMERWGNICENNWWTNLLYVNNFVNTSWLCQGEAWYLANDMQFYIVSPFFLLPLYHSEMLGIAFLAIATILSIISPGLMVHVYDTTPTTIGTRDSWEWFRKIYIKPYARIQTYFVGIWLGYLLFKTKGKRIRMPIPFVLIGWILAFATMLTVLFGIHPWFDPLNEIPDVPRFFYASLNRFAWATAVAWIIFACVKGYGGLINDFLSWKLFMPLGRVCYCVFLVSLHLQMMLHISQKQPMIYSSYLMVNLFFGHMIMSFSVGWAFTLFIETPFMHIEKLIFEGAPRPPRPPPPPAQSDRNGIFYDNVKIKDVLEGGLENGDLKKPHQP